MSKSKILEELAKLVIEELKKDIRKGKVKDLRLIRLFTDEELKG